MRITRRCYAQLCAHTWAPAHARAHTSAHTRARIGRPAAHDGPRRTDDPAARVPPAVARRPGRKGRRIPSTTW